MCEKTFDYRFEIEEVHYRAEAFLRAKGWRHTSSTPGCRWLFTLVVPPSIATRDVPAGAIILADRDMALAMQREIDVAAENERHGCPRDCRDCEVLHGPADDDDGPFGPAPSRQPERFDFTKPPPGYVVRDTSFDDFDCDGEVVGAFLGRVTRWTWSDGVEEDNAPSEAEAIEAAWKNYAEGNDPPGYVGESLWGDDGLPITPALHVFLAPGEELEAYKFEETKHIYDRAVRTGEVDSILRPAMWTHYKRRVALAKLKASTRHLDRRADVWPQVLTWPDDLCGSEEILCA